jgi:hypothetical protein
MISSEFATRTYAGIVPRPATEILLRERENAIIVGTPWGNREALDQAAKTISEFLESVASDPEATSPFPRLGSLSQNSNTVRISTFLANEATYQKCNSGRLTSACELLLLAFAGSELSWIQVGQPHLLLIRDGRLEALGISPDLSMDYKVASPLPIRLLGTERQLDLEVKSIMIHPGDFFIFLNRSTVPRAAYTIDYSQLSAKKALDKIYDICVQENADTPFSASALTI